MAKDPEYVAAYDALEEEFALASALIKARGDADMTQEQVAAAMGTTQAFVARLESGRVLPSTRTLERFAKATHTKLRISFEPTEPRARPRDSGAEAQVRGDDRRRGYWFASELRGISTPKHDLEKIEARFGQGSCE